MQAKRIISMILALALMLGVVAPCIDVAHADANTLYGENLEQVTEPAVGESYYMGADVNGTMMYFRHGTVSDTVPYSLVVSDNFNHNWVVPVILEDPSVTDEKYTEGFQLTYTRPDNGTLNRIYCMDSLKDATVAGQTGIMDTGAGAASSTCYKNRHNFYMEDLDGLKLLKSTGNGNVLVIKQVPQTVSGATADAWRLLGVPVEELANEGVYPVMLLQEHEHNYTGNKYEGNKNGHQKVCWCGEKLAQTEAHTFGAAVVSGNAVSRSCTACGYVETAYDKYTMVTEPKIGGSYYLAADVNGELRYFTTGGVTETTPYSLKTAADREDSKLFTLEDPMLAVEGKETGFQLTYDNGGKVARIYFLPSGSVINTGTHSSEAYRGRHTVEVATVNGMTVVRKVAHGTNANNNMVLVAKEMTQTVNDKTTTAWRMLVVPESELGTAGVYPVMLLGEHEHEFGTGKAESAQEGHTTTCWCGEVGDKVVDHTYGQATINGSVASRSCTACGYVESVYGQRFVKADEAVVGNSYYMAANANGTVVYFRHGVATDTTPYSLVGTTNVDHNWVLPVTLEDPALATDGTDVGFQLTYNRPDTGALARIYCYNAVSGDATIQTGVNTANYKNRHTFKLDEIDGVTVLRKHGNNDYVLAAKYNETKGEWRILGVDEAELKNEGVYPVSLMVAHEHEAGEEIAKITDTGHSAACWCGGAAAEEAHTYGEAVIAGDTAKRACTVCGYVESVYGQRFVKTNEAVVGNSYYMAANANGTVVYFRHGVATDTTPYSLVGTTNVDHNWVLPVTLEDPALATDGTDVGFQLTYTRPDNGALARIYCYNAVSGDATIQTGVNTANYKNRHTFKLDEIDGVTVLRKHGNNTYVLAAKYNETKGEWRILGVDEAELKNEGVYPVSLMVAHEHEAGKEIAKITDTGHSTACWCGGPAAEVAHTYGKAIIAGNTGKRACTECGYVQTVYGQVQQQVKTPVVGGTYYLSANVNGTLKYFCTPPSGGSVTNTSPYSLYTTENAATSQQVTLLDAITAGKGEFQLAFGTVGAETFIYCHTTGTGTTKTSSTTYYVSEKASFYMDEVNGVSVLRKYGNDYVLVVKQLQNSKTGDLQWHMQCVPEAELANEGVYPAMLSVEHAHTYSNEWTFDEVKGTQSKLCVCCGAAGETLYGTDVKGSLVTEPVIGNSYHLAANAGGKLIFFRHGVATETVPYSLVATDDFSHNWVLPVTIEDPALATEGTDVGFQMTYINPSTNALARIYCYNAESSDPAMDTGINSANYKGRHTFMIDEVNGVTVLRKLNNNNILVVKYNETKGQWRMLGVPEAELANEGVYPVMLMNVHEHIYGEELVSDSTGHYHLCQCGSKQLTSHSYGEWTMDSATMTQSATCEVCGYKLTVASPYFDTVDSLEELTNGLAETVSVDGAYTVTGGKDYYLMADTSDGMYYFRNAGMTAGGNSENTSSTVTDTTGHSLYTTNDPNHENIFTVKVTPGNTENTYVLYASNGRIVYVRNEGTDANVDTGMTGFAGVSENATYKARSEFKWDAQAGYLYQVEDDVRYVLVMKKMTASYNNGAETVTDWRIVAVPVSEAEAVGNYPVVLANHVHNLTETYETDGESYWRACGCGYKSTINWSIVLGESIGVNFDLKREAGETVTVTVAGEEVPVELTEKAGGITGAFVQLAAAQMTDEVVISVGGRTLEETFSVRAYADMILASEAYTTYAKDLVKAMLVYGGAAQNYFDHNTEALADDGIEYAVTMPTDVAGIEVFNELTGVKFHGAALVHEGRTAVRFYFEAATVEGLTFTVDGNVYEPVAKDGKFYIEIAGINPQNLNQEMNVVVTDGEKDLALQYSPLTYIIRTYQKASTSAAQKELVKALYGYHKAAKTYIANMYLGTDFALKNRTESSLYEGVTQYKNIYVATGEGEVEAYAIVIDAKAEVELKVSACNMTATSSQTKTVAKHFRDMKSAGNNVLAMINGGFFDLNTNKTMKPYGMQIVDGVVKQAPSAGTYSNNWFGMTKDGKYVISDAAGYESTYAGNVQQGVGGGKLLMIDGVVQNLSSDRDYRTAVGVNAAGDLVLVAVENATYSDVNQIFVDLNMDIVTVLNLDGGGSTAMYVPGAFYPKALMLGEDGYFAREIPDAVAIVAK